MSLYKCDYAGHGNRSMVYRVSPSIVVKCIAKGDPTASGVQDSNEDPFELEYKFYHRLRSERDRCPDIIECFLDLPGFLFLSYCSNRDLQRRYEEYQQRETRPNGFPGRLICVVKHEEPGLIARWIQQVTSALAYIEKLGFTHNDVHPRNCLLDHNLNVKLCDFDRTTTIGQFHDAILAPWAQELLSGPLKGTNGLTSARTEQFAVGTLLYFMVYGHEPYEDEHLEEDNMTEVCRRFSHSEFPELNRDPVLDGLISACWYNVYPTMGLVAYDFKRKTKEIALEPTYDVIAFAKEKETCEALIREGLLGPELASQL